MQLNDLSIKLGEVHYAEELNLKKLTAVACFSKLHYHPFLRPIKIARLETKKATTGKKLISTMDIPQYTRAKELKIK